MEGDAFEMEDQRNWTDASYKTYVARSPCPGPTPCRKGEALDQAVRVDVRRERRGRLQRREHSHQAGCFARAGSAAWARLRPHGGAGCARAMPTSCAEWSASAYLPPTIPAGDTETRRSPTSCKIAQAIGAEPWLEAVIVSVDDFAEEIAALGRKVDAPRLAVPGTVLVSPLPDLKCTLPGSPWPPAPPPRAFFRGGEARVSKGAGSAAACSATSPR